MSIARHVGLAAPVAVWLLLAAAVPTTVHAQGAEKGPTKADRAAARDAYDKGTSSFEHGNYVDALDSFVKANALIPSVQAMFWIAQAQDKLGRTDAAIEAYEAITWRGDFGKLSDDKAATVRERLAALKAQKEPPPAAAEPALATEPMPAEHALTEPPPASMPAPPISEPPPPPADDDVRPARNTAELGVLGGALLVSDSHNFMGAGQMHRDFEAPVWQLGVRAAFFPEKVFGVEAEWAHGFGSEAKGATPTIVGGNGEGGSAGSSANFDAVRGP